MVDGVLVRIGILGDLHGDAVRLGASLDYLRGVVGLDGVVCVGDVANLDADTEGCCRLLRALDVDTVRGNHDRWFFELMPHRPSEDRRMEQVSLYSRAWLSALPASRSYLTTSGRLLLSHGIESDDMAGIYPDESFNDLEGKKALRRVVDQGYRWLIVGHTHRRMVRRFKELTIVNPGTVCEYQTSGFCIVDFQKQQVEFYEIAPDGAISPIT